MDGGRGAKMSSDFCGSRVHILYRRYSTEELRFGSEVRSSFVRFPLFLPLATPVRTPAPVLHTFVRKLYGSIPAGGYTLSY